MGNAELKRRVPRGVGRNMASTFGKVLKLCRAFAYVLELVSRGLCCGCDSQIVGVSTDFGGNYVQIGDCDIASIRSRICAR
jgi:hypothetical protein